MMSSKLNPQKDSQLAQNFDERLKEVMEDLSETVNNVNMNT